ncbi:MAG: hypothetical protein ACTSUB_06365 [Candidatus Thorarchaeota archaeon]
MIQTPIATDTTTGEGDTQYEGDSTLILILSGGALAAVVIIIVIMRRK